MKTAVFMPPVRRAAGGVAVLRELADTLAVAGYAVEAVFRERGTWTPEGGVAPYVAWADLRLSPEDLWLVPEGWPNALLPGLRAGARCVVYCQNWAYLLGSLPSDVAWTSLPVEFLAVSDPVAHFVEQVTGRRAPVLRPGIDLDVFRPPLDGKPTDHPRVAFMPRKNKALADGVRDILTARRSAGVSRWTGPDVEWVEISGLDRAGVSQALGRSHVFLATGYPEGCPLPPLEALACGGLVVGFAGFGGFDYMRQLDPLGYAPGFCLRDVPWGGNGFYSADADILGAALGLEKALELLLGSGPDTARQAALVSGATTAAAYSLNVFRARVLELWAGFAGRTA